MEQNDQVREEPVTGDSGEVEKAASKEVLDSSTQSSEEKEDTTPTAENAEPASGKAAVQEEETNTPTETPEPENTTPSASESEAERTAQASPVAEFDYSTLSREDLVNRLEVLLETQQVGEIRDDVDHIKINFYKKVKQETDQKRKKFVEEGGAIEDF